MSTPLGTFECIGDTSGGDLGSRFAVLTTVWYSPKTGAKERGTYAVLFDSPAAEYGQSVQVPYRAWFDGAVDRDCVGETIVWP